jgi:hypothetical protein
VLEIAFVVNLPAHAGLGGTPAHHLIATFIQHAYVKQAVIASVLLPQLRQNVDFYTSKAWQPKKIF